MKGGERWKIQHSIQPLNKRGDFTMANEIIANAPKNSVLAGLSEEKLAKLVKAAEKMERDAAKRSEYNTRRRIHLTLLTLKAKKAGITVTNAEVDAEIKRRGL